MSDVPAARQRLLSLAKELRQQGEVELVEDLEAIEQMLHRKPAKRTTPVKNRGMTSAQWDEITHLSRVTQMSQSQIAAKVGLNAGRVSEVINGHRKRPT